MSAQKPELWTVAVCLFNNVTGLDFLGPVELFGFLSPENIDRRRSTMQSFEPKIALNIHYLSVSLDLVTPISGPQFRPTDLFTAQDRQYDVLLVPGGHKRNNVNVF